MIIPKINFKFYYNKKPEFHRFAHAFLVEDQVSAAISVIEWCKEQFGDMSNPFIEENTMIFPLPNDFRWTYDMIFPQKNLPMKNAYGKINLNAYKFNYGSIGFYFKNNQDAAAFQMIFEAIDE